MALRGVFKHQYGFILSAIIFIGLIVRLYKIDTPLADWHSFRQADTASVTREYVKHGIDLLKPRYHDLSNIQSGENHEGRDNLEGYRMVEFPLVNGILALFLRTFPIFDLVITSRLASVITSLFSLVFLVELSRLMLGKRTALVAGFFFAFLPFNIYYSRVILPEPFMIAFSLVSLWCYYQFRLQSKLRYWVGFVTFMSLALLTKPMAIFFLPVIIGIRSKFARKIDTVDLITLVGVGFSVLPLYFWRQWIQQFSIGIPVSDWLYNGVGKGTDLSPVYKIRFKPAWWRWIFYERLAKLVLGFTGIVPFVVSFIKFNSFLYSFAFSGLLYVSVFAAGNVQHDYYQALLMPFVALGLSVGVLGIYDFLKKQVNKRAATIGVVLLLFSGFYLSGKMIAGYYHINHPDIVLAGKRANDLLPAEAKVIAPYMGDTAFLFQTNRTGWPIGFSIENKIAQGAQFYVSVNYDDETNRLMREYKIVEQNAKYVIIDLRK